MKKEAKLVLIQNYYQSRGMDLSLLQIEILQHSARTIQRLALYSCSGKIDPDEYDRRIRKLRIKLTSFLDDFAINGDPRRYCLRVRSFYPEYFN